VSLDEPIEIVDYDPQSPARFRGERDRLRIALATASLWYEHIGSSAVPGLAGKPIVDIMLGAPPAAWAAVEELRGRIAALGYEDLGDAGVPGRYAFRRRGMRAFNLALVEAEGEHWKNNLAVRDYLRAHPAEAAAYAAAKRADKKAPALAALIAKATA
jgi:GrpB-like predicted nucleotidyltransferase (UPF0157 family)